MENTAQSQALEKQLGLWDVYALATGATLSSGFFLLPGLAAAGAGPAMPLSYLLAALILLPGLLSKVELATAMPKAGGIYYFLDRSMGPLVGTIGGFGTWIALILKSAFALIGVGAYLHLFLPGLELGPIAAGFAVFFGIINYFGAKKSGSFQVFLLIGLLILLLWFCGIGLLQSDFAQFSGFYDSGSTGIISTAGLVIVSYMGLTKVSSVAEEVKDPERNLPLGMFLSFGTIVTIYVVGTSVMVGVVGVETLAMGGGDLTPVATVAESLVGPWGAVVMTVAAVLAFSSVANAGVLSASRYPLAMGRDRLLPTAFGQLGSRGTPTIGIVVTVGLILLSVVLFDPTKIAKLASAFKLVMFALACLAVIVMRESRIESYDPGFRSPFYPSVQIVGILGSFWLIVTMGILPTLFTGGLITFGAMWFTYYARDRVNREGAIFHVFERLGRQRYEGLDRELREVMKERGPREADPFDELLTGARVLDIDGPVDFKDLAGPSGGTLGSGSAPCCERVGQRIPPGHTHGSDARIPRRGATAHAIGPPGSLVRPACSREGGCALRRRYPWCRTGRRRTGSGNLLHRQPPGGSGSAPSHPGADRPTSGPRELHARVARGRERGGAEGGPLPKRADAGDDARSGPQRLRLDRARAP